MNADDWKVVERGITCGSSVHIRRAGLAALERLKAEATSESKANLLTMLDERRTEIARLIFEAADHDKSFEIRWNADMRAIERWRAEKPGRELILPDHADLCVWLLEQVERQAGLIAEAEKVLEPIAASFTSRTMDVGNMLHLEGLTFGMVRVAAEFYARLTASAPAVEERASGGQEYDEKRIPLGDTDREAIKAARKHASGGTVSAAEAEDIYDDCPIGCRSHRTCREKTDRQPDRRDESIALLTESVQAIRTALHLPAYATVGEMVQHIAALEAALREVGTRIVGMFDSHVRPTYSPTSKPDDDLRLMLVDIRAALARKDPK